MNDFEGEFQTDVPDVTHVPLARLGTVNNALVGSLLDRVAPERPAPLPVVHDCHVNKFGF